MRIVIEEHTCLYDDILEYQCELMIINEWLGYLEFPPFH